MKDVPHPNADAPAVEISGQPVTSLNTPVPILDFGRQYAEIGPELLVAVEKVLASQHFILGEQVSQFEQAAAEHTHARFGIGCSSGTDALWLALEAAEIGPGDAVVTTPFSFFATVSSILRAGARPLLADIDPATYNLDPAAVERLLRRDGKAAGVKAVLPVHLYGQPVEWNHFDQVKTEFDVVMIEDAAQAFGAAWDGVPAGSLGDLAAFSFYPTKNLSACGDAGLVTTSSDGLAERARMLRVHGMRRRYYHDEVGWNCRLDTLQAAVLLVKLQYIDRWNDQRRALAAEYGRLFASAGLAESGPYPERGVALPYTHPLARHVFHQYVIRVRRRDELRAFLQARQIGSEVYYPVPLHLQECLKNLGYQAGDLPESERAAQEVLALPIFPELTGDEQQVVVSAIAEFFS
jgi:dTDP-4-amino-4,6-dideoxygalactose transaminase